MTFIRKTATRPLTPYDSDLPASLANLVLRLARIPGLRWFSTVISRILAVARPTEFLYHKLIPNRKVKHAGQTLTVVSANLWHDWPRYRRLYARLEAFASMVETEEADLVLLQEVARTNEFRVDEWLAQRLGMAYVYARNNGHEEATGFEEGLAILSRYPLTEPEMVKLEPDPWPMVRRQALGASAKTPWGDVWAVSAHLGHGKKENANQINHLKGWVGEQAGRRPALIGGDFNVDEKADRIGQVKDRWIDLFRRQHPDADGTTYEIRWPWGRLLHRARLDYIFLQPGQEPWQVNDARHVTTKGVAHSDHRAVIVRLTPGPDPIH